MFANSLFQQQFQDFLIDQYNQGESAYSKMFSNNRDFYDLFYQLTSKRLLQMATITKIR